jgi:hypothetical protein
LVRERGWALVRGSALAPDLVLVLVPVRELGLVPVRAVAMQSVCCSGLR